MTVVSRKTNGPCNYTSTLARLVIFRFLLVCFGLQCGLYTTSRAQGVCDHEISFSAQQSIFQSGGTVRSDRTLVLPMQSMIDPQYSTLHLRRIHYHEAYNSWTCLYLVPLTRCSWVAILIDMPKDAFHWLSRIETNTRSHQSSAANNHGLERTARSVFPSSHWFPLIHFVPVLHLIPLTHGPSSRFEHLATVYQDRKAAPHQRNPGHEYAHCQARQMKGRNREDDYSLIPCFMFEIIVRLLQCVQSKFAHHSSLYIVVCKPWRCPFLSHFQ